jgi:hypothetical protein
MVLKDKKLLFLHIPKTAGQSITKFLLENSNKTYTLKNSDFGLIYNNKLKFKGPKHYHHLRLDEYHSLRVIDSLEDYFKFTVFRNPYTRFVSAFNFNKIHHKCETYKEFVSYFKSKEFSKKEDIFRHFVPQLWYIDNNTKNIDKYFFYEDLKELEIFFFKKYGFSKKLGSENISNIKSEKLDNYTKDFVKDFYKKDFELLGYDYETP